MSENKNKGGIFKGNSHANGGIDFVVPETGQQIEVEGNEPLISIEALKSDEIKEYTGTNFQILNKINESVGAKGLDEKANEVHAGDVIICKKTLHNKTIKTLKGTHRQIISAINTEAGCAVIEEGATITDENGNTEQFENGGEVLLAPNRKTTNLTPEQYKLVRTPEFKEWFGDWENYPETASKVVDENGEPLVVYHGSEYEFNIFDKSKVGANYTESQHGGFFFSEKKKTAENYAKIHSFNKNNLEDIKKGFTYQVFLNIGKPIIRNVNSDYVNPIYFYDYNRSELIREIWQSDTREDWGDRYEKDRLDGILIKGTKNDSLYVVFEPNQIKLVDGTNNVFDSNNPDVRFNDGGQLDKGIKIEQEHLDLYNELEKRLKEKGVPMVISKNEFFERIAQAHINEIPNYYTLLDKMEEEAKNKMANGGRVGYIDELGQENFKQAMALFNFFNDKCILKVDDFVDFDTNQEYIIFSSSKINFQNLTHAANCLLDKWDNLQFKEYFELPTLSTNGNLKSIRFAFKNKDKMANGGSTEKTYVAEADFYVRATSDDEAAQKAREAIEDVDQKIAIDATVNHLYERPSGIGEARRIFEQGGEINELVVDLYRDHHKAWDVMAKISSNVCEKNCVSCAAEIAQIWESELKHHFKEEEEQFFPSIKSNKNSQVIDELLVQHKWFLAKIKEMELNPTPELVKDFCDKLIEHIKLEEYLMGKIIKDPFKNKTISDKVEYENGGFVIGELPSSSDQKEKYPIVLEWTEGDDIENKGYNSIEELEADLVSFGFTNTPNETYIKNKIWVSGYPHYIRIDNGKQQGDFNFEEQSLMDWFKNYDQKFDFSQYSDNDKKLKAEAEEILAILRSGKFEDGGDVLTEEEVAFKYGYEAFSDENIFTPAQDKKMVEFINSLNQSMWASLPLYTEWSRGYSAAKEHNEICNFRNIIKK